MPVQKLTVVMLLSMALSACVIDARKRDTLIGPERLVDIPLQSDAELVIRIPVGELRIEGVDGDRLQAEMELRCPDSDSRCARRLADLAFVTTVDGRRVYLGTNKNSSLKYRDADVRTTIRVPAVKWVEVNMKAGELDISGLTGCLTVDMGAGDVEVDLPESQVASVLLDAGVGDASMEVAGRHRSARRSLLIGAELAWNGGRGDCKVDVDLQAGEIFLELTEG